MDERAYEFLNNFEFISRFMSFEPMTSKAHERDQNDGVLVLKNLENNATLRVRTHKWTVFKCVARVDG